MKEIKTIFVIGSGIMGHGIAQVFAEAGFDTFMRDINEAIVSKGMAKITNNLSKKVSKGKLTEEQMKEIVARLHPVTTLDQLPRADLVIEAATENLELKTKILQELNQYTVDDAIIATNTSSISVTKLAACTKKPENFIGMHFFNPVQTNKIVELIPGLLTNNEVLEQIKAVVGKIDKEFVVTKDFPAFLLNRMLLPMLNEAFYCYMEGMGTAEEIDKGMRLGMGHAMGPLQVADFIGLDTVLSAFNVLYEGFGDPKYFPCPILKKLVDAGHYGAKSGRGFYDYTNR